MGQARDGIPTPLAPENFGKTVVARHAKNPTNQPTARSVAKAAGPVMGRRLGGRIARVFSADRAATAMVKPI